MANIPKINVLPKIQNNNTTMGTLPKVPTLGYKNKNIDSNPDDPTQINSILDVLNDVSNFTENSKELLHRTVIDPIKYKDGGALLVNNLINFGETVDILANPVKALLPTSITTAKDYPELTNAGDRFKAALGYGVEGRYSFDADWEFGDFWGNQALEFAANMATEVLVDPLNWFSFGAKEAISSSADAVVKATAKDITNPIVEEFAPIIKKSLVRNIIPNYIKNGDETKLANSIADLVSNIKSRNPLIKNPSKEETEHLVSLLTKVISFSEEVTSTRLTLNTLQASEKLQKAMKLYSASEKADKLVNIVAGLPVFTPVVWASKNLGNRAINFIKNKYNNTLKPYILSDLTVDIRYPDQLSNAIKKNTKVLELAGVTPEIPLDDVTDKIVGELTRTSAYRVRQKVLDILDTVDPTHNKVSKDKIEAVLLELHSTIKELTSFDNLEDFTTVLRKNINDYPKIFEDFVDLEDLCKSLDDLQNIVNKIEHYNRKFLCDPSKINDLETYLHTLFRSQGADDISLKALINNKSYIKEADTASKLIQDLSALREKILDVYTPLRDEQLLKYNRETKRWRTLGEDAKREFTTRARALVAPYRQDVIANVQEYVTRAKNILNNWEEPSAKLYLSKQYTGMERAYYAILEDLDKLEKELTGTLKDMVDMIESSGLNAHINAFINYMYSFRDYTDITKDIVDSSCYTNIINVFTKLGRTPTYNEYVNSLVSKQITPSVIKMSEEEFLKTTKDFIDDAITNIENKFRAKSISSDLSRRVDRLKELADILNTPPSELKVQDDLLYTDTDELISEINKLLSEVRNEKENELLKSFSESFRKLSYEYRHGREEFLVSPEDTIVQLRSSAAYNTDKYLYSKLTESIINAANGDPNNPLMSNMLSRAYIDSLRKHPNTEYHVLADNLEDIRDYAVVISQVREARSTLQKKMDGQGYTQFLDALENFSEASIDQFNDNINMYALLKKTEEFGTNTSPNLKLNLDMVRKDISIEDDKAIRIMQDMGGDANDYNIIYNAITRDAHNSPVNDGIATEYTIRKYNPKLAKQLDEWTAKGEHILMFDLECTGLNKNEAISSTLQIGNYYWGDLKTKSVDDLLADPTCNLRVRYTPDMFTEFDKPSEDALRSRYSDQISPYDTLIERYKNDFYNATSEEEVLLPKDILTIFDKRVADSTHFVGHNIEGYDIFKLRSAYATYNVPSTAFDKAYSDNRFIDSLYEYRKNQGMYVLSSSDKDAIAEYIGTLIHIADNYGGVSVNHVSPGRIYDNIANIDAFFKKANNTDILSDREYATLSDFIETYKNELRDLNAFDDYIGNIYLNKSDVDWYELNELGRSARSKLTYKNIVKPDNVFNLETMPMKSRYKLDNLADQIENYANVRIKSIPDYLFGNNKYTVFPYSAELSKALNDQLEPINAALVNSTNPKTLLARKDAIIKNAQGIALAEKLLQLINDVKDIPYLDWVTQLKIGTTPEEIVKQLNGPQILARYITILQKLINTNFLGARPNVLLDKYNIDYYAINKYAIHAKYAQNYADITHVLDTYSDINKYTTDVLSSRSLAVNRIRDTFDYLNNIVAVPGKTTNTVANYATIPLRRLSSYAQQVYRISPNHYSNYIKMLHNSDLELSNAILEHSINKMYSNNAFNIAYIYNMLTFKSPSLQFKNITDLDNVPQYYTDFVNALVANKQLLADNKIIVKDSIDGNVIVYLDLSKEVPNKALDESKAVFNGHTFYFKDLNDSAYRYRVPEELFETEEWLQNPELQDFVRKTYDELNKTEDLIHRITDGRTDNLFGYTTSYNAWAKRVEAFGLDTKVGSDYYRNFFKRPRQIDSYMVPRFKRNADLNLYELSNINPIDKSISRLQTIANEYKNEAVYVNYIMDNYGLNLSEDGIFKDLLKEDNYDEIVKAFSTSDGNYVCVALVQDLNNVQGYRAIEIPIASKNDIMLAQKLNASIIPYDIYINAFDVINNNANAVPKWLSNARKGMLLWKIGWLTGTGVWMRNAIDSPMKTLVQSGSLKDTTHYMSQAMQLTKNTEEVIKHMRASDKNFKLNVRSIDAWFKQHPEKIDVDTFKRIYGFFRDGPSAGLLKGTDEFFDVNGLPIEKTIGEHIISTALKPMSNIEKTVRLAQFLQLQDYGYSRQSIFKIIKETQFDYANKTRAAQILETIIPFYSFFKANCDFWVNALGDHPDVARTINDYLTANYNAYDIDYEEWSRNKSVQYYMLSGAIPVSDNSVLKVNPSFMDVLNVLTDPVNSVLDQIFTPLTELYKAANSTDADTAFGELASMFDTFTSDPVDSTFEMLKTYTKNTDIYPIVGTIMQRINTAKNNKAHTEVGTVQHVLSTVFPNVFGAMKRWDNYIASYQYANKPGYYNSHSFSTYTKPARNYNYYSNYVRRFKGYRMKHSKAYWYAMQLMNAPARYVWEVQYY